MIGMNTAGNLAAITATIYENRGNVQYPIRT
jgi:hypothetical protein